MEDQNAAPKPQSKMSALRVTGAILLGVLILIGLIWFYENNRKNKISPNNQDANENTTRSIKYVDQQVDLLKKDIELLSQKIDNLAASNTSGEYKIFTNNEPKFSIQYPSSFTITQNNQLIRAENSTLSGNPVFTLAVNPEYGISTFYDKVYALDYGSSGKVEITEETANQLPPENSPERQTWGQETNEFHDTNKTFRAELTLNNNKYIFGAIIQRSNTIDYEEDFESFITSFSTPNTQ